MSKDIKSHNNFKIIKEKTVDHCLNHTAKKIRIIKVRYSVEDKNETSNNNQNYAIDNLENAAKDVGVLTSRKTIDTINNIKDKAPNTLQYKAKVKYSNKKTSYSKHLLKQQYEVLVNDKYIKKRIDIQQKYSKAEHLKNNIRNIFNLLQSVGKTIKSYVSSLGFLTTVGTGCVLVIVIMLFLGLFVSLVDNKVYGSSFAPLSDEVIAYTDTIEYYAEENNIKEYVALIQAIMMVESKGVGTDPMDVGTLINKHITNPNESIELGIKYLAKCLSKAKVTSPVDTDKVYLAIQGYDYQIEYIAWALDNFEGYSKLNTQIYNDLKCEEYAISSYGDINYVTHVLQYIGFTFGRFKLEPDFNNEKAWGYNNPYSKNELYGQCTWFAWGRFYEIYGYSPEFTGNGWDCAKQLVKAHPEKFKLSYSPQVGAIFSCIGNNHVGIVVGWDGKNITIQEGNLDGITNTFAQAKSDWQTVTYEINYFRRLCDGVIFANKK